MTTTRADCEALDAADLLAPLRGQFDLREADARGLVYLDGNSLGVLPAATAARLQRVVADEWGRDLIQSWNSAGWIEAPRRIGDKIARLVGAAPGELVVADSTSVNLYKALATAIRIARADAPGRDVILSERGNFPTDLYIADSLARSHGMRLVLADGDAVADRLDGSVAILLVTQVDYRSGRLHDMTALTRAAHDAGALAVWDLAHSAGALPVDLNGAAADFAVGCGYKYLNGGPGAPAFVWAHARHLERIGAGGIEQPLSGWLGHAAPFAFTTGYRPAGGIASFQCGTPPVLSLLALECGVDTLLAAEAFGGIGALRSKSLALTSLFIDAVETLCAGHGLALASPREPARRGSQVSLLHAGGGAWPIVQALIARGVVGDFRAGDAADAARADDLLRFGFTPLYTRFVDAWDAADRLRAVLAGGEWREARFAARHAVT